MSKELVRVEIQTKLRIFIWELLHLANCNCLSNLYTRCEERSESPLRESGKVY